MAERLTLRLLGSVEVEADDQPVTNFEAATARALLAYLAMHRKQPQTRTHLAGLLWGLDSGTTGLTNLRSALRRVRKAVDGAGTHADCLHAERETVQLAADLSVEVDAERFEDLLRAAQSHHPSAAYDCEECASRYRQAVDLYRGTFLADLAVDTELFDNWRSALQDRYRRQAVHALYVLAEYEFRGGSLAAAEELAHRQLELERWNEESHRQLMRILLVGGRRSAALAQYEVCRAVLASELGAVPSEETDALYARIVAGIAPPAPVQRHNPYKGLEAFTAQDSLYFFGREGVTKRLLASLQEQPIVALIGASGSGKSSVVHAGLVALLSARAGAQLAREGSAADWRIAGLRPGATPLAALAEALAECGYTPPAHSSLIELLQNGEITLSDVAAGLPPLLPQSDSADLRVRQRLLLIVDQFEEIFTLCRDTQARAEFLRFLLGCVPFAQGAHGELPPAVVLMTMRADFLGQALQYRSLAEALQAHTVLLGPMARFELQRAIEEPARLQGAAFEPGLVDRLLDDVGAEPGRLPLLQFALALLWLRQQDGWLTHAAYDEIGGMRGALTDYADDVYLNLSLAEQPAARRVLLNLVEPGLDTHDVRHLATRGEIGDEYWGVVQRLADARLVVTNTNSDGEETAELAHEALIREWDRLREWLASDREFRRWLQQTRLAADLWRQSSEDESALLHGGRLSEAERWAEERYTDISPALHRYIAAAVAVHERQRLEKQAEQERELAQVQAMAAAERRRAEAEMASRLRLRRLTIGVAFATCFAVAAALVAWQAQQRAEDNARVAHSRQVAAQAVSVMHSNPDLALLLGLEALRLDPSAESQTTLFRELEIDERLQRILHGPPSAVSTLGLQGEARVLTSNQQGALVGWDIATGDLESPPEPPLGSDGSAAHVAAVSPLGDRFATTEGATALIWEVDGMRQVASLAEQGAEIVTVFFTRDGQRLLTVDAERQINLWDLPSASRVATGTLGEEQAVYGPVNLLGTILLVDDREGKEDVLEMWDLERNQRVGQPLTGHSDALHGYGVSPDGALLATASFDGSVRLWETATGAQSGEPLLGNAGRVLFAVFSPDGATLATGGTDASVLLWDVASHTLLGAPLRGHSSWVRVAQFSEDGSLLATGDDGGDVILWDLDRQRPLLGHTDRVRSLALSPDQATLVTSGFDKRLIVWDAQTLAQRQVITSEHPNAIISIEYSPDGTNLVSVDGGGHILFWDTATWQPRFPLQSTASNPVLIGLAFSPDSRIVAAGAFDGAIRMWDVDSGQPISEPIQAYTTGWALSVQFDPTGKLLASGGEDGIIKLWDPATGAQIGPLLEGHTNKLTDLAFSPDGKTLISSSADGTVRFWNVEDGKPLGLPLTSGSTALWVVEPTSNAQNQYATLDGSGTLALWDTQEPLLQRPLLHAHLETEEMKMSADGSTFYLASTGPTALALRPQQGNWAQNACAIANRSLSAEEWEKYMNGQRYDPVCKQIASR